MDFVPDDEQNVLIASAADLLAKELPHPLTAPTPAGTRDLIQRCAALGWFGLAVPESAGGVGAQIVDEMLVFRELGRALAPGPFLATLLGARVALGAGDTELAGQILDGRVVVALAEVTRTSTGDAVTLAFDSVGADVLLVVSPDSLVLQRVGVVEPRPCIDELSALGVLTTAGESVASLDGAAGADVRLLGQVLLAATLTGIAEATLAMSVQYLMQREQFGRPIGSFQALKHRAADMAVDAELAAQLTTYAALSLSAGDPRAALYCMSARAVAARAALNNAKATIQNHGAMGTTYEHPAHFFLKRVHVLDRQLGGTTAALRAVLDEPSPLAR